MAQDNQRRERRQFNPEEMAKRQTERVVKELGLNEEQAAALLKLNTERMAQMGPNGRHFNRQGEGDQQERPTEEQMKEMREKMDAQQKAYTEEVKKILTEEQFAKFETMQKRRFGGPNRGGRRGEGRHRDFGGNENQPQE